MRRPDNRQLAPVLLDCLGFLVALAALVAMIHHFHGRVMIYDEGLLLTHAYLVADGAFPFRDFYSVYPPGAYYLIAGLWKVLGVSISATRLLGFFIHLVIAACAGRLAGLASGRRFSLFAGAIVLLWISPLGLAPYAWLAALATALLTACIAVSWTAQWLDSPAAPRGQARAAAFACGILLGAVSGFRHDLFVYFAVVLGGMFLGAGILRRIPWQDLALNLAPAAAGVVTVLLLVWLPTLAIGGVDRTLGDLYFNLSRYVMPGREYPLTLDGPTSRSVVMAGMLFCLAGPLAVAGLAWLVRGDSRQITAVLLLGAVTIASFPQMLLRFDGWHILYAAPAALSVLAVLPERFAGKVGPFGSLRGALAAAMIVFLSWPIVPEAPKWTRFEWPSFSHRHSGMPQHQQAWRREVLAFIAQHARPGEPIFVGNAQHRRVTFNDLTLYYLAERRGATRYLQFDPGQVTRAEVQREMITQLEMTRPTVAVLLEGGYSPEPNQSSREGAPLLDEYIRSRYRLAATAGVYQMLLRRP